MLRARTSRGFPSPLNASSPRPALSRAVHAWISNPDVSARLLRQPLDLLAFVEGVHAFFQDRDTLEGILNGRYKTIADVGRVF